MRLILASTSPRRHELLRLLRIQFEIAVPAYVEQQCPDLSAVDQVRRFAEEKARSCRHRFPNCLIIGCDTLIEVDSEVLGKPADLGEACLMLRRLSGRQHQIHTGVAIVATSTGHLNSAVETVYVQFKDLTPSDVERYVATGESLGKAGAYAIQGRGADLIERIDGDYPAAVGLPLRTLARILAECGQPIPVDLERLYQQKTYPNWARFTSPPRA